MALYLWSWCAMPTTDIRLFEATFGAILANAVREPNLLPETLICVFSLLDLYTR